MTYRKRAYGRLGIACRRWLRSNSTAPFGAKVPQMKRAIALVLLFGVLLSMCAHADEAQVTRPRWVIFLTITDRTTGEQVEQHELEVDLTFEDLSHCQSFVALVGPIPSRGDFAAVLTCREIERKEVVV
jgi:hypothetical protein